MTRDGWTPNKRRQYNFEKRYREGGLAREAAKINLGPPGLPKLSDEKSSIESPITKPQRAPFWWEKL